MIVRARDADRFVARPPAQLLAALFFGPDQGLVRERARLLAQTVVPDLADPFRVAELEEATLESDPARIWDEAAALSMTGGRRVLRVRGAGNALAQGFERFLAEPVGDALIVVEAAIWRKTPPCAASSRKPIMRQRSAVISTPPRILKVSCAGS